MGKDGDAGQRREQKGHQQRRSWEKQAETSGRDEAGASDPDQRRWKVVPGAGGGANPKGWRAGRRWLPSC